jgi:outer membrane protein assembly factor BamB
MSIGLSPTAPLYYDDKLFIGTVDGLEIIELHWLTKGQLSIGKILSPPIANSGLIIVGTAEGHLYAFNGSTSNIAWEIDLSDEIYLSNEWDHYVFAGSGTQCHKINCVSGEIEWRYPTDAVITSRPFVAEGVVYFGSWDTYVYAVDADTGALKWKYETGWGVETTPVVDDGVVIVGSHDHNVYALHQDTGSLSWVFSCKAGIHSSPAVGSTCIIIGSDDGSLYCLNKTTGVPLWLFTPGHGINGKNNYATTPILSTPTVYEDAVYIGTMGTLYNLVL